MNGRNGKVVIAAAIAIGAMAAFVWNHLGPSSFRRPTGETSIPYGLQAAAKRYFQRGGKYEWGANDCSMFLIDYLKAHDVPFTRRLTTKEFADPRLMKQLGLNRVTDSLKPGDVLVYRFRNGRSYGHCGVVVLERGDIKVVHNSKAAGGLTTSSYDDFIEKAEEVGVQLSQVLAYRPIQ